MNDHERDQWTLCFSVSFYIARRASCPAHCTSPLPQFIKQYSVLFIASSVFMSRTFCSYSESRGRLQGSVLVIALLPTSCMFTPPSVSVSQFWLRATRFRSQTPAMYNTSAPGYSAHCQCTECASVSAHCISDHGLGDRLPSPPEDVHQCGLIHAVLMLVSSESSVSG